MDIKPQNIVIDCFLNAKLIDFSISLNYKGKNSSDEICLPRVGTSFYMAPEVLAEKKIKIRDIHKIDLYSLGVMLYNLAFAKYPYNLTTGDDKNYDMMLDKIMKEKLDLQEEKDFSKYFIDFITKLLEKDVKKRINIFQALDHYWIKGAQILMEEKEKIYNVGVFLPYLMTDYLKNFMDYIEMK